MKRARAPQEGYASPDACIDARAPTRVGNANEEHPMTTENSGITKGRIVRRTLWSIGALLLAVIVGAAVFVSWTVQRSFPQYSGSVSVTGLQNPVTVQRDNNGIPTITAETSEDLFFTQGYTHAQDRFFEMDFRRHVTSGRVAELFGASQVPTDRFLRTLGWHRIAEQEVAAMDGQTLSYYQSYADGVNAYLADHKGGAISLEYSILGFQNADYEVEPWVPADSVAWLKAMAWDLRTNIEDEITRALMTPDFTAEEMAALYPGYPFGENPTIVPPTSGDNPKAPGKKFSVPTVNSSGITWASADSPVDAISAMISTQGEGVGSNSWVVSGKLTDTGMPYLANDPHLGAAMPSVWTQVTLRCETVTSACPFNVSGFSFSGLPGIVIGHNDTVAWGFTNLTTDVADLYIERLQGDQYWREGKLVDLQTRQETIKVAGGPDETLIITSTEQGPIISGLVDSYTQIAENADFPSAPEGDAYAVSLRWTALDVSTSASAIFGLNTARDIASFRDAASRFDVPAQNLVYADTDGNIAYQQPGRLPIRGAGNGSVPQPGWDSSYDWQGFIPFEELNFVENPAQGYIVTANNAIVDDSYEYFLSVDWDYGYRAARITELLEQKISAGKLTQQDMRDIQNDKEFFIGSELSSIVSQLPVSGTGPEAAVALLGEWDGQNDAGSAAAAYANVLWDTLVSAIFTDRTPSVIPDDQSRLFRVVDQLLDDPESDWWVDAHSDAKGRDAVLTAVAERAYDRLVALQGADTKNWNWGALHAITITSDTFGSSGIELIEMLFNRGPYPVGGGASVVDATGWTLGEGFETVTVPSMRMVIDLNDFDASTWIHLTGQSGHAFHRNYVDQTQQWANGMQNPWAFTPDAVAASTLETLTLQPKS